MTSDVLAPATSSKAHESVILCADDFAISEGVTAGIEDLALARRLSATSALVTLPRWPDDAPRLVAIRSHVAIGLHINLTLGAPLRPMPRLAPTGRFPALGHLVRAAVLGAIDRPEITAEASRQIEAFRAATGTDPDFIDGHQHVHALPGVRDGILAALAAAFPDPGRRPLVRNPADRRHRILARRISAGKSLLIALLSSGFGRRLRQAGFPVNDGFSGVSAFDRGKPYGTELASFLSHPGPCHLVMCHPGRSDAELAALDPVTARRQDELEAIAAFPRLPELIWHPRRDPGTGRIAWPALERTA